MPTSSSTQPLTPPPRDGKTRKNALSTKHHLKANKIIRETIIRKYRNESAIAGAEDDQLLLCSACSSDLTTEAYSITCDSNTCKHIFHPSCLGNAGPIENEPWFCILCKQKQTIELKSRGENDICICQKRVFQEDSIFCDSCYRWYHPACIKISQRAFSKLRTSDEDYCCPSCTEARSN